MTDDNRSRLPAECTIIQKMNDNRFQAVEDNIDMLQDGHEKNTSILIELKEAIIKLTMLQEKYQEQFEREKEVFNETLKMQSKNLEKQNEVIEESIASQSKLMESLLAFNIEREEQLKYKTELNGKKIVAIAGIVSSIVATIGTIIVKILG
jgi:hypothetical protein